MVWSGCRAAGPGAVFHGFEEAAQGPRFFRVQAAAIAAASVISAGIMTG